MKQPIALVVLVAFLMQLSGCAIRVRQEAKLGTQLATDIVVGLKTENGEEVHFNEERKLPYNTVPGQPSPKGWFFWEVEVRSDTLHAFVDGKPYQIAGNDIEHLWVKRINWPASIFCSVVLAGGIFYIVWTGRNSWEGHTESYIGLVPLIIRNNPNN